MCSPVGQAGLAYVHVHVRRACTASGAPCPDLTCPTLPLPCPQCNSCYAYASVAAVAAVSSLKQGSAIPHLSVEQVLRCSTTNFGCNGGWPRNVSSGGHRGEEGRAGLGGW